MTSSAPPAIVAGGTTLARRWRPRWIQITSERDVPREAILARIARGGSGLAVQLRDPGLETGAFVEWGRQLRAATRAVGGWLVVNDRLDVALALDADGVHLGRASIRPDEARLALGDRVVSCSVHDGDELERALRCGADAVVVSPVFPSPGKGVGIGLEALARFRSLVPADVALVALGGVTAANAPSCFAAGADAVAAIRADLTSRVP